MKNRPLGHIDDFELKALKRQPMEGLSDFLILKEKKNILSPGD